MQRIVPAIKSVIICVALAGVASWLTVILWPLSERFPFAFFLVAVVASAWSCGPVAAIFTTVLCTSSLGYIYYWQSPNSGFELVQDNLPRLVLFLFTGLLTSYLVRECRGAIAAVDRVHLMLGHLGEALITTDPQGTVRYINQEAQMLTGYEVRDAIGKPLGHVLALHDESNHQPIPQPTQAVSSRRVAIDLPAGTMLQSARGKHVAIEGRAAPIVEGNQIDGVAITFRDVTRRRAEDLVGRRQLEQWQRAVVALPDPVFIKDELGNYIGGNAAAAKLVARDMPAIAGAEDAALFSPEVARNIIQADREAFETGQPQSYQLAVGEGETGRVFDAVKTPILGPDGKLCGLVDVLHEATARALNEEKLKKAHRELELRLEEQAATHKNAQDRLRGSHQKECEALQNARQNVEESLNEQLAELRRRLDEKTIEHAEAQALLDELAQKHADELDGHLAAEKETARREHQDQLDRLKTEHAGQLENAVKKEQQRGEGLLHLAQQEHATALSEYQDVWELTEQSLQQARKDLEEHRAKVAGSVDAAALGQEREEMIQRLAEQTAARLGLEESLRRAHERIEELKSQLDQPAPPDHEHIEEIRHQVASEHEQKWNEAQVLWQHRLVQVSEDHDLRLQTAQEGWQRLQTDYERQLAEARERHRDEIAHLQNQLAQPRGVDPQQVEEVRRQALAEQERKWHEERLALEQQLHETRTDHQRTLDTVRAESDRKLEEERARWEQRLQQSSHEVGQNTAALERKWEEERARWQRRLDESNQQHEERYRSAEENWRQTFGDYDRRLTEARNHTADNERLRQQLEEHRQTLQQMRGDRERLEEMWKSRRPVPANGNGNYSGVAVESWDAAPEPANGDWLSFN
jgi:PAS domain S-box-containing protein